MASSTNDMHLTAQCLCKAHTFTATVPASHLPLRATACHCTSCRRLTGALYSVATPWPGDSDAVRRATLVRYDFSARLAVLFCGVCSSPMFWNHVSGRSGGAIGSDDFSVFTGVLGLRHDVDIDGLATPVRLEDHMFVGDTVDGGASVWMHKPNGSGDAGPPVRRWRGARGASEELAEAWPGVTMAASAAAATEVPIRCHCGGVDLVFLKGRADDEFAALGDHELPRHVDPVTRKYVAGTEVCDSCRLSSGVDFFNWTFAALRHIGFPGETAGSGVAGRRFPHTLRGLEDAVTARGQGERDARLGTLAVYRSSAPVRRYFCSRCSASVLYAADHWGDDIVDVAVGLLHAEEGARAEGSLAWLVGGPVHHREDAVGGWRQTWLESIEAEAEKWRVERKIPEWWAREEQTETC